MRAMFQAVLNMSIAASYLVLLIIVVRLLLHKAPKIYSYLLWSVVLFHLLCPASLTSKFKNDINFISNNVLLSHSQIIENSINRSASAMQSIMPTARVDYIGALAIIWLWGFIIIWSYSLLSYFRTKRHLTVATRINNNIYESDLIQTPFVIGCINPRIYLPTGLVDEEFNYILQHEQTHIKRWDHIIKPLAFFALTIHWFNPLIWLSFYLMKKDMEMSCDESVLKQSTGEIRLNYARSLLSMSVKKNGLLGQLAFGESNTKKRIKNILNYKKPSQLICMIAALAVIIVITGGVFLNPQYKHHSLTEEIFIKLPQNELVTEVSIGIANDKIYGYTFSPEGDKLYPPVLAYQFKLKDGHNLFAKYNPDLGILLVFDDKWLQNEYGMLEGMSGYAGGKDSLIVYSHLSYADEYQKNNGAPFPDRKTLTQILEKAPQATLIIHERENELLRLKLEDYRKL